MSEDLVSIIIPVYNVEPYLTACLTSVLKQSYLKLEIILIDDGSTDNSGKLCDIWEKQDKRIKVVHKRNGGLSDARNKGLEIAKGEWILFIDSDDYIQRDLVKKCYETAKQYEADLVFFEFERVEETCEREIPNKEISIKKEYSGREMLVEFILNEKGSSISCNKFYSKKIWTNLHFPTGKIHEDEYVIIDIWERVEKAVHIDEILYYYRQRKGSILHSRNLKSRYDVMEAFWLRCKKLQKEEELYYRTLVMYFNSIIEVCAIEPERQKKKKLYEQLHLNWSPKIKEYLSKKNKILMELFYWCPEVYLLLLKWKRRWKRRRRFLLWKKKYCLFL